MKKQNVFLEVLSDYLSKYITVTKGLSQNTIRSYTYTFQLLFAFLKETRTLPPEKVNFNTFDQNTLEAFLVWMEEMRGCSINTRNQKLSGLSAFAKYAITREPVMAAGFYSAVNGIPKKKSEKTIPVYFTKEEIELLLHIPSGIKRIDIRNRTLLSVLYATGARAQELCDIKVGDIHFGDKTSVKLVGKGNKARKVTIPTQCAVLLRDYLSSENKLTSLESHAFSSQTNEHMTISCVEEIVKKYVRLAKQENPSLFREKNYSPHSFRHSIAVHMLEAEIPLPVIKNFLGHSSIETTMIYATVSDELKNRYLKENGIVAALMVEEKKNEAKHSYPGLHFLNRI
ncbi:site-specific integrase [Butyrivibrio fibrisolvens]|uniref:tyrosine-type recombinase/integrase n=1 Tax=Pseudobutyrivibrio ruminis TaxID=46206 RepID=UPI00040961E3|nr:tyrosine-type recombinase/integrase [Pseudobutyrivibrio ruminis]MDC7279474.1 site-specific integrase [Butyrivibrio fibrisolvens]